MFRNQRFIYIPESLVKGRVHKKQTANTSDKTIPECEGLWIGMFEQLAHEEMCEMNGSERHFWINQANFMKETTPYTKTTQYAYERLKTSTDELRDELVSIVTPFYNRIHFVIECIKSVQQQSYKSWELILVNDGSEDYVGEVEHLIATDNRIKLINTKHTGVANARNIGIDAATGKFIAFLDSDDTWHPQKLEKQIAFMLDNNFCVSHTSYNRISSENKLLDNVFWSEIQGDVFDKCLFSCSVATPCVIVEKEFLGCLRFPKDIDYGEDTCVWLELAWRGKWGCLPEVLTSVYISTTSASQDKHKQQLGYVEILRYILKKPEWVVYQTEIGVLAIDFVDMFPRRVFRFNLPRRFINAVRRYGIMGTWKVFWRRIKIKLRG